MSKLEQNMETSLPFLIHTNCVYRGPGFGFGVWPPKKWQSPQRCFFFKLSERIRPDNKWELFLCFASAKVLLLFSDFSLDFLVWSFGFLQKKKKLIECSCKRVWRHKEFFDIRVNIFYQLTFKWKKIIIFWEATVHLLIFLLLLKWYTNVWACFYNYSLL